MLPLAFFASCNNDDDLPEVDLTLTLSGVTKVNDTFYAVQGDKVSDGTEVATSEDETGSDTGETTVSDDMIVFDSFTATSLTGKNASVANVVYYLNTIPVAPAFDEPYFRISTSNLEAGTYTINVTANVLQVDKSIANAAVNFPLVVVSSAEQLPDGAPAIGTQSITVRMQSK